MVLLVCTLALSAYAEEPPAPVVFIDGLKMEFEVEPTIINGSTLVPLRAIFEQLGSVIEWDNDTRTVIAVKNDIKITYTIGQTTAKRNNDTLTLSTPGQILDNRTLVPLRFVSEALGASVGWEPKSRTIVISSAAKFEAQVIRVIDGDTVEIEYEGLNGTVTESARLIGVDTPETVHPTIEDQPYGKEASDFTMMSLNGKAVLVEMDLAERDQFGRLLVYLYSHAGSMFNATLVAEGYAQPLTIPPSDRWTDLFAYLSTDARSNDRGLWGIDDQEGSTIIGTSGKVVIVSVNVNDEIVIIRNNDTTDVNMTGWKLVSVLGHQTFDFPDGFILKPQQTVSIVSGRAAAPGDGILMWSKAYLWNNEEDDPAELHDPAGIVVSEYN